MQIACHYEHKWFHPDWVYGTVYLDDVKQNLCTAASEEDGFIERYCTENGKIVIIPGGQSPIERVTGKVRIEIRKPNDT